MEGGDGGGGVVDASVGTIVWVRRRNGSWWPGRILGSNELAESHLLSPRSGTPVKLLGREDASVDWYNLEKSKRVKAFRCGEFDACIERAEAAQGVPIKKREKYARREDAILHALELERKQLETRFPNQPPPGPAPVFSMSDEPRTSKPYKLHGAGKKADVVSHRYKSKKPAAATSWDVFGSSLSYNGVSNSKKRPLENAGSESPVKKKDRRKPLLQVLQSTSKSPLPLPLSPPALHPTQTTISHAFDTGAVLLEERSRSIPVVSAYPAKSQCAYLPTESKEHSFNHGDLLSRQRGTSGVGSGFEDFLLEPTPLGVEFGSYELITKEPKLEPVTDTEIRHELGLEPEPERMADPDSETETETEASPSGSSEETDTDVEGGPENLQDTRQKAMKELKKDLQPFEFSNNDTNAVGNTTPLYIKQSNPKQEASVSQWNIKGKRNIRNTAKRSSELISDSGSLWPDRGNDASNRESTSQLKDASTSQGFYQPKEEFDDDLAAYGSDQHDYQSNHSLCWNGYENAPMRGSVENVLFDVDLQVKASYQGERVPLVSLMSRLNGKAIVGHPVQIEIVEDGSTSVYLPDMDSEPDSSGLPPVWRTGRRTVMQRVPRSMIDHPIRKKPVLSKSHKKSTKKVNARQKSKSKTKTKTISSLGNSGILGGLIKPDGGVPLVTCVPVKIVFSRILEAVGRPSLHRARMPSPAVRDPP